MAIECPSQIQTELVQFIKGGSDAPEIRWITASAFHLTLKFLGEVEASQQASLASSLTAVAQNHAAFSIWFESGGVFPQIKNPKVFWTQGQGEVKALEALAAHIDRDLSRLGFAPEARAFKPHLTVGRIQKKIKPREGMKAAQQFCKLFSSYRSPSFEVQGFCLFQSHLAAGGAQYEKLASFSLRTH